MNRVAAALMLAGLASCSKEEGTPPKPPPSTEKFESAFSKSFDLAIVWDKCARGFSDLRGQGQRSNIQITPPGRTFKDFTLTGDATDEAIRGALADLRVDLLALAKTSGVKIVQAIQDTSVDRLGVLPYEPLKNLYSQGLQGFHFSYTQEGVEGAVDVLAGHGSVDGKKEWMLVCSVHEAR